MGHNRVFRSKGFYNLEGYAGGETDLKIEYSLIGLTKALQTFQYLIQFNLTFYLSEKD